MFGTAYKICPSCGVRAVRDTRFCPACGSDVTAAEACDGDPYLGLILADKYMVEELIGEGAMGRVYKAKQVTLGKPFAIKILATHLMNDEASHARFANEAHNAASLNHPNCVSTVDYGRTPSGVTFIVMEYIHGATLEQVITEQSPMPRDRIVDLALQILAALTEAHGLGILHRDLKPENILVQQLRTHGELAKVLDFGIAKLMEDQGNPGPGLTSQGMVCGTPEYMSPEQARGQKLDFRSDLYAVGVILYQMLTGRPPFESASAVEVLHKHLHEQPIPPSVLMNTEADELEAVCLRAMAKDPDARLPSAQAFRDALIAATSAASAGGTVCNRCAAEMRAEHRFCPSCGAPAPKDRRDARARPSTRGSAIAVPVPNGEPTAEVVVRNFPLPLAGRDEPLASARTLLAALEPRLTVRVLGGPRGVGKTRLGDEIANLAEAAGWRAFYVGADPSGARAPLWPIQCMVAQLLELEPATVTTHDLGRVANLTGLAFEELPGLAELFSLVGPAHDLEFAVRRRECFASAVQAMLVGGRGSPLLLIFDDIDAWDMPSREVVRRLTTASAGSAVAVLCMTSERNIAWLGRDVLRLEPLAAPDVAELGRRITVDARPNSSLPDALAAVAPVTPLRLETHLRLLSAGLQAPGDAPVEGLLRMRIEALDPTWRHVIELAAVLGERFLENDLVDLYEHNGGNAASSEFDRILEGLHVAGMVVVLGNGERAFSHGLLHQVAYATIAADRRRALHAMAAHVSRLARNFVIVRAVHLVRARSPDVVEALVEAARRAERGFDDMAAADFIRFALGGGAKRTGGRLSPAQEVELTLLAARVMRDEALAESAVALLQTTLSHAHVPADEARLLVALGEVQARAGHPEAAVNSLKKALGSAIAVGDQNSMMLTYHALGKLYADQGELDRAISELSEGLDIFTLGEGPRAEIDVNLWRYLLRLCETTRSAKHLRASRTWAEHALFQAERRQDRLGLLRCHSQMAWVLRDLDQMALAEQHLARALDESRHYGDRLTTAELLIERARARASRGRLADATRCCEEALRLANGIQWAGGIDHAQRAIRMLTRNEPPHTTHGPAEHSGRFGRAATIDP